MAEMDMKEKLVELQLKADIEDEVSENTTQHREYIADLMIANGVTVQEWISVKDRLPKDASTVLAIDSDGTICSAYYVGRWHGGGDLDEDAVTHWMPLPKPPNEVAQ